jgi:hypothetical protein
MSEVTKITIERVADSGFHFWRATVHYADGSDKIPPTKALVETLRDAKVAGQTVAIELRGPVGILLRDLGI